MWRPRLWLFALIVVCAAGCAAPQAVQPQNQIAVVADGKTRNVVLPAGSTVQQALSAAQISLNSLDRAEPPVYTVLSAGSQVRVVRVTEKFEVRQTIIPFEHQTLRNESLAKDRQVLLQRGKNGIEEITYRHVYEDGVEVSKEPAPIKSAVIEAPTPEILMVGIQSPFAPLALPGRMFYLRDGNVWKMEGSSGSRQAVLTPGDLDGRVFTLSDDGAWLLFTRQDKQEGQINKLWAVNILTDTAHMTPVNVNVPNVVHFADWIPGSNTRIIFSTVEKRQAAPGWQANNDLNSLTFSLSGWTTKWTEILGSNNGGVYGWWGMNFAWSPDGTRLAFARPDSLGLLNPKDGAVDTRLNVVPLQTRGDWAWVPPIAWGPDGKILYTVDHVAPAGAASPEESQQFDLTALPLEAGRPLHLVASAGMFAYPLVSPMQKDETNAPNFQVAYLQALAPLQSESSRYRLMLMDRDGSDQHALFPDEGQPGITPQQAWGAWSPAVLPESHHFALAVIYQGNLWVVDTTTGQAQQLTGDGLTTRVIWK